TVSLTHSLIRSRSFQAWVVNTASRPGIAGVSHSGAYCVQNSRQPSGARAAAPADMNSGRSPAAWAGAIASAAASAAPARPAPSISAKFHFILWPLPVLEGHISHKRFESPLISQSHFKDNKRKKPENSCNNPPQIKQKLNLLKFKSKAGVTPPTPAGCRSCCAGAITVNARSPRAGGTKSANNGADKGAVGGRRGARGAGAFTAR